MSRRMISSACRSKIRYPRKKLTLSISGQVGRRHGVALTAYHCGECHGWHLTKKLDA